MPRLLPTVQDYAPVIQETTKMDSNSSIFLARDLLYKEAKAIKEEFPNLIMRNLFPVNNIGKGFEQIQVKTKTSFGDFAVVGPKTTDLPKISGGVNETFNGIKLLGASVEWTKKEMDAATRLNIPLQSDDLMDAREIAEMKIDNLLFRGSPNDGIKGLISFFDNYSRYDLPTDGSGASLRERQRIVKKIPSKVIRDFNGIIDAINNASLGTKRCSRVLVSTNIYNFLAGTKSSDDGTGDTTLLDFISRTKKVEIIDNYKFNAVPECNDEDLIVGMVTDARVATAEVPVEFEMEQIEKKGFVYNVDCSFEISGIKMIYPKAFSYAYPDATTDIIP